MLFRNTPHPLELSVSTPAAANLIPGSHTQVESTCPAIYRAAVRGDIVDADTRNRVYEPLRSNLEWNLEIAVYVDATFLLTDEVQAWLYIQPIGNAVSSVNS